MSKCEHDKVYGHEVYTTSPPLQPWICQTCGERGKDKGEREGSDDYLKLVYRRMDSILAKKRSSQ
jgi:hypothetical protein